MQQQQSSQLGAAAATTSTTSATIIVPVSSPTTTTSTTATTVPYSPYPPPSPPPSCSLIPSALCARRRVDAVAPLHPLSTTTKTALLSVDYTEKSASANYYNDKDPSASQTTPRSAPPAVPAAVPSSPPPPPSAAPPPPLASGPPRSARPSLGPSLSQTRKGVIRRFRSLRSVRDGGPQAPPHHRQLHQDVCARHSVHGPGPPSGGVGGGGTGGGGTSESTAPHSPTTVPPVPPLPRLAPQLLALAITPAAARPLDTSPPPHILLRASVLDLDKDLPLLPHSKAAVEIIRDRRRPPTVPPSPSDRQEPIPLDLVATTPAIAADSSSSSGVSPSHPPAQSPAVSSNDPIAALPPMDVRDIISRCEDASMSWSLQFWVTIADPQTHHVFFACPASGQCSWEPPVGAFVVPRSPDGEWWELADPTRDNQSYYYNTLTGVTQWERPEGDALIIPLGLIQRNALPAQPDDHDTGSSSAATKQLNGTQHENNDVLNSASTVRFAPKNSSQESQVAHLPPPTGSSSLPGMDPSPPRVAGAPPQHLPDPTAAPHTYVGPHSPTSPTTEHGPVSWWERRRRARKSVNAAALATSPTRSVQISPALSQGESMFTSPPSPIPVDSTLPVIDGQAVNINLVLQPSSPNSASYDLHNFSTEDFADRYFATKRSGVLRQRLSLERIMEWQRNPITSPLLVLSKASVQDAMTTFKVIQHVMGERDRPVEGARAPPHPGAMALRPRDEGKDEKTVILEEIRWMIQLGVGRIEMRDELYCQLIKQLTRNPDKDGAVLGFQLFCVFVAAFGPSKSFEPFVRAFLIGNVERTDYGIGVMSKFCLTRIDVLGNKGGRGRVLTMTEIEHASDAAFYPSVYGQTLETIMQRQEGAYPELRIPIILPFLADGILALGGTESEGIFRVPGDADIIAQLKAHIDRGQYHLTGVEDPHVVASLFKLWLRELEEPLIPVNLYNAALQASKSVDYTIIFIKKLPDHNRRVLLFVISFIQLFLDPEVIAITKMTPQNLALVLAPNVLRTPSESLATVFANSSFESQFVLNLLLHLDPPSVDPEYVPSHGGAGAGAGRGTGENGGDHDDEEDDGDEDGSDGDAGPKRQPQRGRGRRERERESFDTAES